MNIVELKHSMGNIRATEYRGVKFCHVFDVARGLGISNWHMLPILSKLDIIVHDIEDEKWLELQDMWRFILESKTTKGEEFKDWICNEVLPGLDDNRLFVMEEATPKQILDAKNFRLGTIELTFNNCLQGDFDRVFKLFQEFHKSTPYALRIELIDKILAVVTAKGWVDIKNLVIAIRDKWRIILNDYNVRVAKIKAAKVTAAETNQHRIEDLTSRITELTNTVEELRKCGNIRLIENDNGMHWPEDMEAIPIHGFTVNKMYGPCIKGLDPKSPIGKCNEILKKYLFKVLGRDSNDAFADYVEMERSPMYNYWIEEFDKLDVSHFNRWNVKPGEFMELYVEYTLAPGYDLDNVLKSFIDRLVAKNGLHNDRWIKAIYARCTGQCSHTSNGSIRYCLRPLKKLQE